MIVASPPPRFVLARSDLELWALLNPLLSTRTLRLDFVYVGGGLQKVAFLCTSASYLIIKTIHILPSEERLKPRPPRGVGDGRVGGVQGREGGGSRRAHTCRPHQLWK